MGRCRRPARCCSQAGSPVRLRQGIVGRSTSPARCPTCRPCACCCVGPCSHNWGASTACTGVGLLRGRRAGHGARSALGPVPGYVAGSSAVARARRRRRVGSAETAPNDVSQPCDLRRPLAGAPRQTLPPATDLPESRAEVRARDAVPKIDRVLIIDDRVPQIDRGSGDPGMATIATRLAALWPAARATLLGASLDRCRPLCARRCWLPG